MLRKNADFTAHYSAIEKLTTSKNINPPQINQIKIKDNHKPKEKSSRRLRTQHELHEDKTRKERKKNLEEGAEGKR